MKRSRVKKIQRFWSQLGPKYLPFADAASTELPLGRLLRLSLFQISVGLAAVLLTGTLNRVMIGLGCGGDGLPAPIGGPVPGFDRV